MLGKLIKYEFKSTSRVMWFLYGALIVVGALLGFILRVDDDSFDLSIMPFYASSETAQRALQITLGALGGIYVLMIQAIFIMTIIMIITRFNRNLLGGEGYLMHTLPVKTHNLILSKGIVAIIWGAIAIAAGILSGLFFSITSGILGLIIKENAWEQIWRSIQEIMGLNTALFIIAIVIGSIATVLAFYFAMAIGNLANKNKFLYAVLAYVGIQIVLSIILSVIGINGGGATALLIGPGNLRSFLITSIVEQLILCVGFFFGTNYILKNKLNLA